MCKVGTRRAAAAMCVAFSGFLIGVRGVQAQPSAPSAAAPPLTVPGVSTKMAIGPAGGVVASPDGRARLSVPAGALSTAVEFWFAEPSAQSPGALRTYRVEPRGTTFTRPATLTFAFDDEDLRGSTVEALRLASPNPQGDWDVNTRATVNASTGMISLEAARLADWSLLLGWQLRPGAATVRVGQPITLRVVQCLQTEIAPPTPDGQPLVTLKGKCDERAADVPAPPLTNWAVNGQAGGTPTTGRVAAKAREAVYTAPARVPQPPLVAVSVDFSTGPGPSRTTLVSNITVVDDNPLPARVTGSFTYHWQSSGQNIAPIEWQGTARVTAVADFDRGVGQYSGRGTFFVQSLAVELGNCTCTAAGGEVPLQTFGVKLAVDNQRTEGLGWAGRAAIGVACQKLDPESRAPCPSVYSLSVTSHMGAVRDVLCPIRFRGEYARKTAITGSFDQSCRFADASSQKDGRWLFVGDGVAEPPRVR